MGVWNFRVWSLGVGDFRVLWLWVLGVCLGEVEDRRRLGMLDVLSSPCLSCLPSSILFLMIDLTPRTNGHNSPPKTNQRKRKEQRENKKNGKK